MAIFCGSKEGNNVRYREHAVELGQMLAVRGITLIYGGGNNGLMGAVANSVMQHGGTARGVIPQVLLAWEQQHQGISELLVVEDMHVRKRKLYEMCDGAVILPGGFGTLDELFEMLTWNQLSIHDKKIFILNTDGFYDYLIQHMQRLADEGFLYGNLEEKFVLLRDPEELVAYL
jgi:uncharacterized protein (TIGR00730 family)